MLSVYCITLVRFLPSYPSSLLFPSFPTRLLLFPFTQLSYITALLGGIHLATYTSSLWLQLCHRLIENPPYKAVLVALLTYFTLISLAAIEGRLLGVSLMDVCLFFAVCVMGGSLRQWLGFVESANRTCRPSTSTDSAVKVSKDMTCDSIFFHSVCQDVHVASFP